MCPGGEIGIHARLKISFCLQSVGSSPTPGTIANLLKTTPEMGWFFYTFFLEATTRFELVNRGFANRCLRPLGYVAVFFSGYFTSRDLTISSTFLTTNSSSLGANAPVTMYPKCPFTAYVCRNCTGFPYWSCLPSKAI